LEPEFLADDGDEDVDGDGDPDLRFHSVGRSAIEGFDTKMLLDPFEEQFDLPPAPVKVGDGQRGFVHVVGQKDQPLARVWIDISNPAQGIGIVLSGVETGQNNRLIEAESRGFVHRRGIASLELEVGLGSGDKECRSPVNAMQAAEVDIAPIHDVESAGLERHLVEDIDVVNLAGSNDDKGREVSMQGQQRVQLDGCFRLPEFGPRKQREAQVDGCRVQCIRRTGQFCSERFSRVEMAGLSDQDVGKVAEDSPIPIFVGVGEGAFGNMPSNAGLVKFLPHSLETGLDVPQALPVRQLGKTHDQKLPMATQLPRALVAAIPIHAFVELVPWIEFHQLGKYRSTSLHQSSPFVVEGGKPCEMGAVS